MIINLMKCYGVLGHEKNLFMQKDGLCGKGASSTGECKILCSFYEQKSDDFSSLFCVKMIS